MTRFIELNFPGGNKILVNVDRIVAVVPHENGSVVYVAANAAESLRDDHLVEQSYERVKDMILGATENLRAPA